MRGCGLARGGSLCLRRVPSYAFIIASSKPIDVGVGARTPPRLSSSSFTVAFAFAQSGDSLLRRCNASEP